MTQKQYNFCCAYVETGCGCTAYKQAYDAEKSSPRTATKRASELLKQAEIQAQIQALRAERAATAISINLDGYMAELYELRQLAIERGHIAAAVQATIARGKAAGVAVDTQRIEAAVTSEVAQKPVSSTRLYDSRTGRTIKEVFDDGRVITYELHNAPVQVYADGAPHDSDGADGETGAVMAMHVLRGEVRADGTQHIFELPDNGRDSDVQELKEACEMERRVTHDDGRCCVFQYPDNGRMI